MINWTFVGLDGAVPADFGEPMSPERLAALEPISTSERRVLEAIRFENRLPRPARRLLDRWRQTVATVRDTPRRAKQWLRAFVLRQFGADIGFRMFGAPFLNADIGVVNRKG